MAIMAMLTEATVNQKLTNSSRSRTTCSKRLLIKVMINTCSPTFCKIRAKDWMWTCIRGTNCSILWKNSREFNTKMTSRWATSRWITISMINNSSSSSLSSRIIILSSGMRQRRFRTTKMHNNLARTNRYLRRSNQIARGWTRWHLGGLRRTLWSR